MDEPRFDFDAITIERLRRRRGYKWTRFGPDVIPVWVADMDFEPAPAIERAVAGALALGDFGYPPKLDPGPLPALFAGWAESRYGWRFDPRWVETTIDVLQGLYVATETLTEPGDGMVIFTPIYPPFLKLVAETGRRAICQTLEPTREGHVIDFDRLRAAIDSRTRVVMWCNPHNPAGRVFTRAEQERLAEIVLEHDLIVFADEIHADLVFPGHEHVPFATIDPAVAARTVTFTSVTKAFNTAGLRCAIAVFGSEALYERFNTVPRRLRGGANSLGLYATCAAWEEGEPWLAAAVEYLEGNRGLITSFLRQELPQIGYLPPEATFLAWLDCRELNLEPDPFTFFLERAKVGFSDGREFGAGGAGHVRLNFATSRSIVSQALERMAEAIHGAGVGRA